MAVAKARGRGGRRRGWGACTNQEGAVRIADLASRVPRVLMLAHLLRAMEPPRARSRFGVCGSWAIIYGGAWLVLFGGGGMFAADIHSGHIDDPASGRGYDDRRYDDR